MEPGTAPTTLEQLSENLGALEVSLTDELVTELDTAGNP